MIAPQMVLTSRHAELHVGRVVAEQGYGSRLPASHISYAQQISRLREAM